MKLINHVSGDEPLQPKSIILMIGDGMGFNQTQLASLVEYNCDLSLSMHQLPIQSSVLTYSADNPITDSAAAATAIATGYKTNNGMLSVAPNGTELETILEKANAIGMSTGVVTTTYVQHATPAAFMAHVLSRNDVAGISQQIVNEPKADIILGGGFIYFTSTDLNSLESQGYELVRNRTALMSASSTKIMGLFADSDVVYEESRNFTLTPSLKEMTNKSLEILSQNQNGFFLIIEGGRIDHAGHDNNKVGVALETISFDEAVRVAIDYVSKHENTSLIVTADHETGGLSIINHNLSTNVPTQAMTEEERRQLRIDRINNVTVGWTTDSHTSTNVPLYSWCADNPRYLNYTIINNVDIFKEMESILSYNYQTTSISTTTTVTSPSEITTSTASWTSTTIDTTTILSTSSIISFPSTPEPISTSTSVITTSIITAYPISSSSSSYTSEISSTFPTSSTSETSTNTNQIIYVIGVSLLLLSIPIIFLISRNRKN